MARNSTERLGGEYDLESRGSSFSYTTVSSRSQQSPSEHLQMWYYAVLKGVMFMRGPLYCCTVPDIRFCLSRELCFC